MHNLLLVSVFGRVNFDTNDRVNSLHDYLQFNVKIVTTDFSHRDKQYRAKNSVRNVDYLHVTPYKKNLSVNRILSHWTFALRLLIYLIKNGKKHEIIYCISPTPSSALICGIYKLITRHKCLAIDIIDIWPEGLIPLSKKYKWISPLFLPWKWISILAFKSADVIIAATRSYQLLASQYNKHAFTDYYPLGIDPQKSHSLLNKSELKLVKDKNELWIAYAGNLGASYDFDSMISAISFVSMHVKGYRLKFIIVGGGDKKLELENKLQETGINYLITGNIEYKDYLCYLSQCDIGFNIFAETSTVIQSYKFNDYIVSGLYVINNLKGETAELIDQFQVGENLSGQNQQLGELLLNCIDNWNSIRSSQRDKCNKLINDVLSKEKIYNKLNSDLLKVIGNV
ncbi:MAG: hypothetical protein WCI92_16335 [Bacteroidota bacterium]